MQARIVIYSRSGHSRAVARALADETGCEILEILCPRYRGHLGWARAQIDALRGTLPDISMSQAIGPADLLIVGGPIWRGRLAAPLRRFLEDPARLPPVIGVFVTRARVGSTAFLEPDIKHLTGVVPLEVLSLRRRDIRKALAAPSGEGVIGAFLKRLKPLLEKSTIRPFVPAVVRP
ncbi:hypothetical protein N0B44_13165 [Roseibacterium beibuensis]|uniref:Flavodoxin-like domain-containing protein n=2 Tax=[Roseibacterium] beibuensis TaxID=1193142 RepID=A0ABP9L7V5_9RHOB|nr:hypothetical protein [Roseibacterium beibuensis]MCS6623865.1 hypothetical protein [Roseibacterium beibuensis]